MFGNGFSAPATLGLIIANVAISLLVFANPGLGNALDLYIGGIRQGEIYRLLTSAFVHGGFSHLLFNMFTLFFFGPALESDRMLGRTRFLILYFVALFTASLWGVAVHYDDLNYSAVGASGAISGVVLAVCLFAPFSLIYFYGIIPVPAILFAILYIGYSIFAAEWGGGRVAHDAHLAGALAGFVCTLVMKPGILGHVWWQIKSRFSKK